MTWARRVIILALLMVTVNRSLYAQCPNTVIAGDQDIWAGASYMRQTWYRDMVADFLNLKSGDWDGGWGWVKYNDADAPRFALPKVMSAMHLLWGGLDDLSYEDPLASQGAWSASIRFDGAATAAGPYPKFTAVARNRDYVDLLYRSADGQLMHVALSGAPWDAGAFPPNQVRSQLSNMLADSKNNYRISGPPAALARTNNAINVVARQGNALLHFYQTIGGAWNAEDVTTLTQRSARVNGSDRFFIDTEPIVIRHGSEQFSAFALDNFRHLIHYLWDNGTWFAEDPTDQLQITGVTPSSELFPVRRGDGRIDVFARSLAGELLQYSRGPDGKWSHAVVSAALSGLPTNARVEGRLAAVSPDDQSLLVYFRSGFALYLLAWTDLLGWVRLPAASEFAAVSDPVVVYGGRNKVHVFFKDIWNALVHVAFLGGTGFLQQRVSTTSIVDDPVAVAVGEQRVDVFATDANHHVVHARWTNAAGWQEENINLTPGVSSTFNTVTANKVAVVRGVESIELFAERDGFSNTTVHFTAGAGTILRPWHTNSEYANWTSGNYHDFKYTPGDTNDSRANAQRGSFVTDRIELRCPVFADTPAARAGTMLHESTHMNHWRFKHKANLPGSSCSRPCSDNWFFHSLRDPAGRVTTDTKTHSMNQIQIEYLADIAEFAQSWFTFNAFSNAQSTATNRLSNRILDPPGWTPGRPRPLQ